MPEYLAPGVYIEETSFRSKSIEGVSTTTTGFIGPTRYGPVLQTPDIITSLGEFERVYGGGEQLRFTPASGTEQVLDNYLWHAARAFFTEGGRRLYVTRVFRQTDDAVVYTAPGDQRDTDAATVAGASPTRYVDGHARATIGTSNAVTIRARFPGAAGNMSLKFSIRLKSKLALESQDSAVKLNGAADRDLVYVRSRQSGAAAPDATKVVKAILGDPEAPAADEAKNVVAQANVIVGLVNKLVDDEITDDADAQKKAEAAALQFDLRMAVFHTKELATALKEATSANQPALIPGVIYAAGAVADLASRAKARYVLPVTADTQAATEALTELETRHAEAVAAAGNTLRVGTFASVKVSGSTATLQSSGGQTLTLQPTDEVWVTAVQLALTPAGALIPTQIWDDVALDPQHTSNGVPDNLFSMFELNPSSLDAARSLPIVVRAGGSATTAIQVLEAVFGSAAATTAFEGALNDQKQPVFTPSSATTLSGGNDGLRPNQSDYEGRADPDKDFKTGLKQFEDLEDISIVAAPGSSHGYAADSVLARGVAQALITHCYTMRYRIAVLDAGNNLSISEVRTQRSQFDSTHAALYYPWVRIFDPITRRENFMPPSGFVAGIYARNDINRAVWKAPANEVVNLALGFEKLLNKAQQDVLNPEGINCFRFFEGRGMLLWGARTISSDSEWKYVNLRRYFAYLERSIDKGTQWAVFEPNGPALWANVRRTIEDFLLNEWMMGALLGDKPEKAYFVKCDRSTMTQNDLDNGRLICLIGVAPVRPAEFVIFRIGQWTGDRKV